MISPPGSQRLSTCTETSLERWQAPFYPGTHAVSCPMGAQAFLAGSRRGVQRLLGRVCDAVEYVVHFGLEHRTLESIYAIGMAGNPIRQGRQI
jgi:hypothetical protein